MQDDNRLALNAAKAGMDEKIDASTDSERLPSEMAEEHTWRTREDPFKRCGRRSGRLS
jgi:hypothetical protein